MKILILNPVSTAIWNETVRQYIEAIASPETSFNVANLDEGPESIEHEHEVVEAAPLTVKRIIEAEREGYRGVIINCFDDPGLHAAREKVSIPVLGIGETSITLALTLAPTIGIISTGSNSKIYYRRKALNLGFTNRIVYCSGIDVGVLELRKNIDTVLEKLYLEGRRAVEDYNARGIVLGCGGFIGVAKRLEEMLKVPVIDPTLITFKFMEGILKLNYTHSRVN